jgi:hypothetical protein
MEPPRKFPQVGQRPAKMSNKSTAQNTSSAQRGKMAQASGHKATVAALANKIPKG